MEDSVLTVRLKGGEEWRDRSLRHRVNDVTDLLRCQPLMVTVAGGLRIPDQNSILEGLRQFKAMRREDVLSSMPRTSSCHRVSDSVRRKKHERFSREWRNLRRRIEQCPVKIEDNEFHGLSVPYRAPIAAHEVLINAPPPSRARSFLTQSWQSGSKRAWSRRVLISFAVGPGAADPATHRVAPRRHARDQEQCRSKQQRSGLPSTLPLARARPLSARGPEV